MMYISLFWPQDDTEIERISSEIPPHCSPALPSADNRVICQCENLEADPIRALVPLVQITE